MLVSFNKSQFSFKLPWFLLNYKQSFHPNFQQRCLQLFPEFFIYIFQQTKNTILLSRILSHSYTATRKFIDKFSQYSEQNAHVWLHVSKGPATYCRIYVINTSLNFTDTLLLLLGKMWHGIHWHVLRAGTGCMNIPFNNEKIAMHCMAIMYRVPQPCLCKCLSIIFNIIQYSRSMTYLTVMHIHNASSFFAIKTLCYSD